MLDKIRVGINQAYQQIADRDNYVTAEKVRNAYLGLGMNHETLLAVFRQHNEDYEKQVGKLKSLRQLLEILHRVQTPRRSSSKSGIRSATSPCANLPLRSSPTSNCSSKPRRITATTRSGLI